MEERMNSSLDGGPGNGGTHRFLQSTPNRLVEFRSPLSTKREREKFTPAARKAAPKMFKTAPQTRSFYSITQDLRPRQVVENGTTVLLTSPHYSPEHRTTFFEQVFMINYIIGKGSYGEVFEATSLEDRKKYAIKISINQLRFSCPQKFREVENHMLAGRHDNIVELKRAWTEGSRLYIQTELCDFTLLAYCTELHILPEHEIWNIFIDLVNAVHHLHSKDMIHDDIKPENVLMTKDKVCKLGDFGLCINLKNPSDVKSAEEGDSKYLAFEVLNGRPTKASDIFSLGMTILEAATDLDLPSNGETWHQIRFGVIPERFFVGLSNELRLLIKWMLAKNPAERPTTSDLLMYPMIKQRLFRRRMQIAWYKQKIVLQRLVFNNVVVQFCCYYIFIAWTWAIAFTNVVIHKPASNFLKNVSDSRVQIAAKYGTCQMPPTNQHTPIQSPEGTSKAFSESMCLPPTKSSYNFSDEENSLHSSPRSPHSQRRLFPAEPLPMLNLDDDDDDDVQATSSSNSSAISMNSPIRRRPVPVMEPRGTPKSARKIFPPTAADLHGGSGDSSYSYAEREAILQQRYMRMLNREQRMDSDDNDDVINEAPMPASCPSIRLRRMRMLKKPAPPDFSCLDESPQKKAAMRPPRTRARMMSSSGDDEM